MKLSTLLLFAVLICIPALIQSQTGLPPPRNVRDLTPNQRTIKTIAWQNPAGIFYQSYNIYYFSNVDPTVRVVSGIQSYSYVLSAANNAIIQPGLIYSIQVSGVNAAGVESDRSAALVLATSPADPKINPALGITQPFCSVSSINDLTCSWALGVRPYKVINVRIKCPRDRQGPPRIRRKFIRGGQITSFTTSLYQSAGKTCKVFFHVLYVESIQPPYPRYARKMKSVRVTLFPPIGV